MKGSVAPTENAGWPRGGPNELNMKLIRNLIAVALVAAGIVTTLSAQVPGIVQYQGRVATNNINFTGTGQFKFVLLEQVVVGASVWSNDGTSANGSEPVKPVSVPVSDGLFSVALGDTSLVNMTTIPTSALAYADVRLRIWFSDGQGPFEQLAPDQRITSVPFAMLAGAVPDSSIMGHHLVDGSIAGTKLQANAIGSGELADSVQLQELNVGGPNWNGVLNLYADGAPNKQTGRLAGDGNGSRLELMFANSMTGAVFSANPPGGRVKLWDIFNLPTVEAGSWQTGGGELRLFQISGNRGIELIGDKGVYPGPSLGGEIHVKNSGGSTSTIEMNGAETQTTGSRIVMRQLNQAETIELDAENGINGGGHIDVRRGDGTTTVSVRASEATEGALLLMNDASGTQTVRIDAEDGAEGGGSIDLLSGGGAPRIRLDAGGGDVALNGGGYVTLGSTTGVNLAIDNNEIMARNNGAATALYLNYGSGTVYTTRLAVNTDSFVNGYSLNVDGRVICEELVVQDSADWPDYVFADDYRLRPLEEVEASIKERKHLPGIPSAKEVGQQGISIGQMQRSMMEKIEELTLYVIEQDKRLKAQAGELQALREQLK